MNSAAVLRRTAGAPSAGGLRVGLMWASGLALLVGLAVSLRMFWLRDGFSEDEFFQLTFINEALPQFFVQFVRLDQHPPFHFLQLKLWGLVSQADSWMLLNSLAWHLVSCAIIFAVGRAWQGRNAGLLAVALYALLPQVVGASATLRFYSMIPGLAVLAWWLNLSLLSGKERRGWVWWALAAVQIALGYSHAIAFFFVAWFAFAAAIQVAVERPPGVMWRRWLAVQSGVGLVLLPLLVLAAARISMADPGEPGGNSDPGNLIDHFGGMVAGWGMKLQWARVLGAAFFVAAIAVGLWNRATRWMAVVVLLGPYAMAFVVGLVLAPMFKTPVYSAMLVPFACLALGAGLDRGWRAWLAFPLLLALATFVLPASLYLGNAVSPYQPIAIALQQRVKPGDVVVIPKPYIYWATMRYVGGPNWGSALEVLPALSDSWLRMTKRLGPELTRWMHLTPRTQKVEQAGVSYVIGEDAVQASATAQRVWLVQRTRYAQAPKLAEGFADKGVVVELGRPETMQIILYERQPR